MEFRLEYNFTKKLFDRIGREFIEELKKELKLLGKSASGNLINSLNYKVTQVNDSFYIEIIAADYLKFVDKGRKPGKMPPIKAIKPWVEMKGIKIIGKNQKVLTSESAAYLIARSIGEDGIKPTNVIDKTEKYIFSKYEAEIKLALGKDYKDSIIKSLSDI